MSARRRILIDGRSGSGKTELARSIAAHWPEAQLVRLDDLYPGWDGLDAGSAAVPGILTDFRWRAWDWAADRLSAASRPLADLALWVQLDDATRKQRALARDGDTYAPHWDRWAAQELRYIAREDPQALADVTIALDDDARPGAIVEP